MPDARSDAAVMPASTQSKLAGGGGLRRGTSGGIVTGVLAVHVGLLLYGSWIHSPNDLEANLLPAGYVHLRYGRFDIAQVNPPLSRMLCALPLLGFEVDADWRSFQDRADLRIEYAYGRDFIQRNAAALQPMFFACRAVAALFSILGAICVATITRRLYGQTASLVALCLWCFCPMVLGHGATTNHDVPAAALLAVTFLALMVFQEHPGWLRSALLGCAVGLACLTRTTCVPVMMFWLSADWFGLIGRPGNLRGRCLHGLVVLSLALLVFNAGYGFSGTMRRLGDYTFFSEALSALPRSPTGGNRFRGTILERLPIPLPRDFVQGLDLQQRDFESPPYDSYLLGEWRSRGWWSYYLVGWTVKTPVGFQLLVLAGVLTALWRAGRQQATTPEALLVVGAAMIYGLASWRCGFTIHYRYVLPAWPLLAIVAGSVISADWRSRWRSVVVSGVLLAGVVESLIAFPHHLDFFNVWAGGARHGPDYLLHSSCDWGQDVYLALDWRQQALEDGNDAVFLLTYGVVTPQALGFAPTTIPARAHPDSRLSPGEEMLRTGLYGISVAHLFAKEGCYTWLRNLEPVDSIGAAFRIYRLTARDIDALRLNAPAPSVNQPSLAGDSRQAS